MTLKLRQSGFADRYRVDLLPNEIQLKKITVLSRTKAKKLGYGEVVAILVDGEKVHVCGARERLTFLHQPGKRRFRAFMDNLLERLKASEHGASRLAD